MTAREALIELLDLPSEDDHVRAHAITAEGSDRRDQLKAELEGAYLAYTLIELEDSLKGM